MGKVPSYRLEQVRKWVFEHGCLDWSKMTNLPQSLRHEISQNFDLVPMELLRTQGSSDCTDDPVAVGKLHMPVETLQQ